MWGKETEEKREGIGTSLLGRWIDDRDLCDGFNRGVGLWGIWGLEEGRLRKASARRMGWRVEGETAPKMKHAVS